MDINGYNPYQLNIMHLYVVCASFWTFPNNIFPRPIEEEKLLFDEFARTVKNTTYQGWSRSTGTKPIVMIDGASVF